MTKELFDVRLTGNLLSGHNRREVTVNLAQLVGTSIVQADQLLAQASCVKQQVDRSTAAFYQEVLAETGAEVVVVQACLALEPSQPITPESTPVLNPEQAIEEEPTPVLAEEEAGALDPDITQPFATPTPAPLRRRGRRWLAWVGAGLMATSAAIGGFMLSLPAPVAPGQALAQVGDSLNQVQPFQLQVEQYWRQHRRMPAGPRDMQWPAVSPLGTLATISLQPGGTLVITYRETNGALAGNTLTLSPSAGEQGIDWDCSGGSLPLLERPEECRPSALQ